jgi:hypothetical protein
VEYDFTEMGEEGLSKIFINKSTKVSRIDLIWVSCPTILAMGHPRKMTGKEKGRTRSLFRTIRCKYPAYDGEAH